MRYFALRSNYSRLCLHLTIFGVCLLPAGHRCFSQDGIPRSPTIAEVSAKIARGNAGVTTEFWKRVKDRTPLVELVEPDSRRAVVTFIWRGDGETKNVQLVGGRPGPNGHPMLQRLAGSNLWYVTQEMHLSSRGGYAFRVNVPESESTDIDELAASFAMSPPQTDPNNSNRSMMFSIFELPEAPPQVWIERDPKLPMGTVSEHKLKSSQLDQTRSIVLYEPAQAKTDEPNNLLVFFDAAYYTTDAMVPTATILDNLIAANEIRPRQPSLYETCHLLVHENVT